MFFATAIDSLDSLNYTTIIYNRGKPRLHPNISV